MMGKVKLLVYTDFNRNATNLLTSFLRNIVLPTWPTYCVVRKLYKHNHCFYVADFTEQCKYDLYHIFPFVNPPFSYSNGTATNLLQIPDYKILFVQGNETTQHCVILIYYTMYSFLTFACLGTYFMNVLRISPLWKFITFQLLQHLLQLSASDYYFLNHVTITKYLRLIHLWAH